MVKIIFISLVVVFIIIALLPERSKNTLTDEEWDDLMLQEWKFKIKTLIKDENPIACKVEETDDFVFYHSYSSIGELIYKVPKKEAEPFGEEVESILIVQWVI